MIVPAAYQRLNINLAALILEADHAAEPRAQATVITFARHNGERSQENPLPLARLSRTALAQFHAIGARSNQRVYDLSHPLAIVFGLGIARVEIINDNRN